jgi:hypothetical protein
MTITPRLSDTFLEKLLEKSTSYVITNPSILLRFAQDKLLEVISALLFRHEDRLLLDSRNDSPSLTPSSRPIYGNFSSAI